jgi:hypothetical protein
MVNHRPARRAGRGSARGGHHPGANAKAVSALESTRKADHVRVDVTGEQRGDAIEVATLEIAG